MKMADTDTNSPSSLCVAWRTSTRFYDIFLTASLVFGISVALPVWGAYTWRGLFSEFYGN